MSALKNTARDAVKKAGTQTAVDAIAVLDGMIAKVEGLQKKAFLPFSSQLAAD